MPDAPYWAWITVLGWCINLAMFALVVPDILGTSLANRFLLGRLGSYLDIRERQAYLNRVTEWMLVPLIAYVAAGFLGVGLSVTVTDLKRGFRAAFVEGGLASGPMIILYGLVFVEVCAGPMLVASTRSPWRHASAWGALWRTLQTADSMKSGGALPAQWVERARRSQQELLVRPQTRRARHDARAAAMLAPHDIAWDGEKSWGFRPATGEGNRLALRFGTVLTWIWYRRKYLAQCLWWIVGAPLWWMLATTPPLEGGVRAFLLLSGLVPAVPALALIYVAARQDLVFHARHCAELRHLREQVDQLLEAIDTQRRKQRKRVLSVSLGGYRLTLDR
jgi:hypothetical protein